MAVSVGSLAVWVSRYRMPHVTVNNFSGSILGRPVVVKDHEGIFWAIFNTGEYLQPIHHPGKIATLVVPYNQINQAGKNYVGRTFVRRTPFNGLPNIVKHYLTRHKKDFNTNDIFYGKFSEEFVHENPSITDYEQQIENLNTMVNLRDDLLEGRNDQLLDMVEFGKRVSGNQKHWWEAFKRSPTADKEE